MATKKKSEVRELGTTKLVAEQSAGVLVEPGTYQAPITNVKITETDNPEDASDPYRYANFTVAVTHEIDGEESTDDMRVSYPAKITPNTGLGLMLKRFGFDPEDGDEIDLSDLIDEEAIFTVVAVEKNGVKYHEIDRGSFSPAPKGKKGKRN